MQSTIRVKLILALTLDNVRCVSAKQNLSKDVTSIQQLGEQHRAIRQVLESCELVLDQNTYDSLADLHDSIVNEKKRLLESAMRKRRSTRLTIVSP